MSYKKKFNPKSTADSNKHMKTLTLRIPAEQFEELNRRAAKVGMNRSDYCCKYRSNSHTCTDFQPQSSGV